MQILWEENMKSIQVEVLNTARDDLSFFKEDVDSDHYHKMHKSVLAPL